MKLKNLLLCLVSVCLLAACDTSEKGIDEKEYKAWLETDKAKDYNHDTKIDEDDFIFYTAYREWKTNTEDVLDYNNDRKINEVDYEIYLGYNTWINSDEKKDYTNDEVINVDDYLIHYDYMNWLDSDLAVDINGDRKINYDDYYLSKNPELSDYLSWLVSNDAKDFNKDGRIDEKDFNNYQFIGTYQFFNYVYKGNFAIEVVGTELNTRNIGNYFDQMEIVFDGYGVKINLGVELKEELGIKYQEFNKMLNAAKLDVTSDQSFNLSFNTTYSNVPIKVTLYFERQINGNYYTSYKFVDGEKNIQLSFEVSRK